MIGAQSWSTPPIIRQNLSTAVFLINGLWTVIPKGGFVYWQPRLFIALDRLNIWTLDNYKKGERRCKDCWPTEVSMHQLLLAGWKRWLIVSLCEVPKRCFLRHSVLREDSVARAAPLTETCHSLPCHFWHRVHREIFHPTSLFETSRLIGSVRGFRSRRLFISQETHVHGDVEEYVRAELERLAGLVQMTNMSSRMLLI